MDIITPGRKLSLDLIAKSVVKIQAEEALNKEKELVETQSRILIKRRKEKSGKKIINKKTTIQVM